MSKGKGQQVIEDSLSPLEFQLRDGKHPPNCTKMLSIENSVILQMSDHYRWNSSQSAHLHCHGLVHGFCLTSGAL